jgi:asparagine synthase (glutamine-hydrolysing)
MAWEDVMSAIVGIYHSNGEPIPPEHSDGIMKVLEHFPANDIQTLQKDNIFLGCHAQWITPESVGEKLPFYDHERQLAITADAIIDNRDELFEKLQVKTEHRKKMADSELILLSYNKWGEDSPKYLVGDFAFMIWDEKERKMFGARDFSGARTLYFFKNQERFAFSTIIKSLLTLPYIEKKLNEQWIAEFIANPGMFESVDLSSTVYNNIHQLPPSHSITVVNKSVKLVRYCTLIEGDKLHLKSDEDYVDAFREVFQNAVQSKLRTNMKVGGHLSGGLDSGSVAAFAAKSLRTEGKQLHTFSYVPVDDFVDWTHKSRIANERPLIESTVNYVGNIATNYLSFKDKNPYLEIDEWLGTLEMPYKFFENTFWLRGIYEEASSQGIGILLNGQRGNWTISWGPMFDYYALLFKKMNWFRLYQEINAYSNKFGVGKRRIISAVNKKLFPFIYQTRDINDEFPVFINKDFASKTRVIEKLQEHGIDTRGRVGSNTYKIRMHQFQQLYYWNTTGTYGAKLSLRYGIVDRDPTNDLRVIRFCLSVPEGQFVQNGIDRSLIRRATKEYLPDDIRLNMRTRGVQGADGVHRMIPIWGRFIDEIEQLITDPLINELIDVKALEKCISLIKNNPKSEFAFEFEFKILMRTLILYRFIKGNN